MIRYIHGSSNSSDIDTVYVFDHIPDFKMLHQLTDEQIRFFKRVWANNNMDISIEEAVDNLDIDKLSIVYYQAKNTIKK